MEQKFEPAFPFNPYRDETGMTLRDYFAAKAMQGLIAQSGCTALSSCCDTGAEWAYKMATSMLWARGKPETNPATERERILADGIRAVRDVISDSDGIVGLHLNGDVTPWDTLRTGGRFETWLKDFDAAVAVLHDEFPVVKND